MIISKNKNKNELYLSWRNEKGEKEEKTVESVPYFYIEADAPRPPNYPLSKYNDADFTYVEGNWVNLDGKPLVRCYYEKHSDQNAKDAHFRTYEADVPYHFRYCVDNLDSLPEYNLRKWYWDMEWAQGGEHDGAITAIVAFDNYSETFHQFTWCPNFEFNVDVQNNLSIDEYRLNFFYFRSEKDMLEAFLDLMVNEDPDMLIAWFGLKFDLPKLLERCAILGIDARQMSPIGQVKGFVKSSKAESGYYFAYVEKGYSPIEQPIGGRITLNLDLAFERQWNDSQRGTLPSLSLEYVSQTLFGEGKHTETKFEDPNEFYRRAWLEDPVAYLQYALQDVELLRKIDETNFTSEAILSLQRLLVAPFDACFYASHMGSIYFMRNASWIAPTGRKDIEREEYEGAMIYHPESEGTNGLHLGVAAFDYAGLYPSMMIARNISWETKSAEPTEFGVNILTPRDFSDITSEKMLYYKTDELGLLPRAVLELKELRNDYKRKMREARENNTGEYQKWYNNQMAVKRLMASFYGIVAFQGFGWADVDLAASITASAREAIREAAFVARGMEV